MWSDSLLYCGNNDLVRCHSAESQISHHNALSFCIYTLVDFDNVLSLLHIVVVRKLVS